MARCRTRDQICQRVMDTVNGCFICICVCVWGGDAFAPGGWAGGRVGGRAGGRAGGRVGGFRASGQAAPCKRSII